MAPTWCQNDLKWYPKVTPKSPKWTWLDLSKTMAVIDPMRFWPSLGGVGIRVFFCLLSWRLLFDVFGDFCQLWGQNEVSMWLPGGGSMGSLFRAFLSFGPSWGSNASRSSPKSPRNHPRPPFLPILGSFLVRFWRVFDTINAAERRNTNSKNGQHSVLFSTVFCEEVQGNYQNKAGVDKCAVCECFNKVEQFTAL